MRAGFLNLTALAGLDPDRDDDAPPPGPSPMRNPFPSSANAPTFQAAGKQSEVPSFTAGAASPHKMPSIPKASLKTADKRKHSTKARPATAERRKKAAQDAASRLQEVIDLTKDRAQPRHSPQKPSGSGEDVIDLEPEARGSVPLGGSKNASRKSFTAQLQEILEGQSDLQKEERAASTRNRAHSHVPSERPLGQGVEDISGGASKTSKAQRSQAGANNNPGNSGSSQANAEKGLPLVPVGFVHCICSDNLQDHRVACHKDAEFLKRTCTQTFVW